MDQPLDPEYDKAVKATKTLPGESHSFEEFLRRQRVRVNDRWERAVQRVRNERTEHTVFENRK